MRLYLSIELPALDKMHLHKNTTFLCAMIVFLFIYFKIKSEGTAFHLGTSVDNFCVFLVPWHSLS